MHTTILRQFSRGAWVAREYSPQVSNETSGNSSIGFYRLDTIPDTQWTVAEHWRQASQTKQSAQTTTQKKQKREAQSAVPLPLKLRPYSRIEVHYYYIR